MDPSIQRDTSPLDEGEGKPLPVTNETYDEDFYRLFHSLDAGLSSEQVFDHFQKRKDVAIIGSLKVFQKLHPHFDPDFYRAFCSPDLVDDSALAGHWFRHGAWPELSGPARFDLFYPDYSLEEDQTTRKEFWLRERRRTLDKFGFCEFEDFPYRESFVRCLSNVKGIAKCKDPHRLQLVHIPKSAGSTIAQIGRELGWGQYFHHRSSALVKGSSWHIPIRYFERNPFEGHDLFCVVRDPIDRLLSEFHYQFQRLTVPSSRKIDSEFLERWIRHKFERLESDRHIDDNHFLPQSEYVFSPDGHRLIEHVLHFDLLDEEFSKLAVKYGLDLSLDQSLNVSKQLFHRSDLSHESLRLIQSYYRLDYEKLGFEFSIP
jgi:hypothetical protein